MRLRNMRVATFAAVARLARVRVSREKKKKKEETRRHAAFVQRSGARNRAKTAARHFIARVEEKRVSSRRSRYRVSVVGTADYPRRLAHFHWPPPEREKRSKVVRAAEVLYKLDVSRIFPARQCVSRCRFRERAVIQTAEIAQLDLPTVVARTRSAHGLLYDLHRSQIFIRIYSYSIVA